MLPRLKMCTREKQGSNTQDAYHQLAYFQLSHSAQSRASCAASGIMAPLC